MDAHEDRNLDATGIQKFLLMHLFYGNNFPVSRCSDGFLIEEGTPAGNTEESQHHDQYDQ